METCNKEGCNRPAAKGLVGRDLQPICFMHACEEAAEQQPKLDTIRAEHGYHDPRAQRRTE